MEDEQRYFMMCTMYNCHTDWHHITCQINQEENTSALCSVFAQSVCLSSVLFSTCTKIVIVNLIHASSRHTNNKTKFFMSIEN